MNLKLYTVLPSTISKINFIYCSYKRVQYEKNVKYLKKNTNFLISAKATSIKVNMTNSSSCQVHLFQILYKCCITYFSHSLFPMLPHRQRHLLSLHEDSPDHQIMEWIWEQLLCFLRIDDNR